MTKNNCPLHPSQLKQLSLFFPEIPSDEESFEEAIILTTKENGKEIKYTFSRIDAKVKLDEIDRICGTLTDVLIMVRQ